MVKEISAIKININDSKFTKIMRWLQAEGLRHFTIINYGKVAVANVCLFVKGVLVI